MSPPRWHVMPPPLTLQPSCTPVSWLYLAEPSLQLVRAIRYSLSSQLQCHLPEVSQHLSGMEGPIDTTNVGISLQRGPAFRRRYRQLCKQTCPRSKLFGIVVDVGQRCQPIAVLIALIVKQAYILHSSAEAQAAYRLPRITIDNNAVVVQRVFHAKAGPINRISQDSPDYIESFPLFIHCFHFRTSGLLWLGTLNSGEDTKAC